MRLLKRLYPTQKNNNYSKQVQLIADSAFFDINFYQQQVATVFADQNAAIQHYLQHGWQLGLSPSADFDTQGYLQANPDVAATNLNPLIHYLKFGQQENRAIFRYIPQNQRELRECLQQVLSVNNWQQAEGLYLSLINLNPGDISLYQALAECYGKQEKHWQEAEVLATLLQLEPENRDHYIQLAKAQEKLNRLEEAQVTIAQILELSAGTKDYALWCFKYAVLLSKLNAEEYAGLIQHYQQAAIDNDTKLDAKVYGLGVLYEHLQLWQQAAIAFRETADSNWGKKNLYKRAMHCALKAYDYALARKLSDLAIAVEPKVAELYFLRAFCLQMLADSAAADSNFKTALALAPNNNFWRYCYGRFLFEAANYSDAFQQFSRLVVKNYSPAINELTEYANEYQAILAEAETAILERLQTNKSDDQIWFAAANITPAEKVAQKLKLFHGAYLRTKKASKELIYATGTALANNNQLKEACQVFLSFYTIFPMYAKEPSSEQLRSDEAFYATYTHYLDTLPLFDHSILFESFNGNSMSCNPYAIFKYLLKNPDFSQFTFVWVVNSPAAIKPEYLRDERIIFIPKNSDGYLRWLCQAQYLVNNSTFPDYFLRKPDQVYLNTWHGTPWKTLGKDMAERFYEHKNFTRNILQANYLLSPNAHTTDVFVEKHDINGIFSGEILQAGYPRMDILQNISQHTQQQIRQQLGIAEGQKIIFYAPTWRGSHENIYFDAEKLQQDLAKIAALTGYTLVFRGHSLLQNSLKISLPDVVVAPELIDTNEILAVTDILITDYSSVLFDYLVRNKPLYLYLYDYEQYQAERGLYFQPEQLPGMVANNIEQLVSLLSAADNYDLALHQQKSQPFIAHDDGQVTARLIKKVFQQQDDGIKTIRVADKRQSLVFYPGPFMGNGITTSFLNLLQHIDYQRYSVTVCIDPGSITKDPERQEQFNKLPAQVNVIARVGRMNFTLEDRYLHGYFNNHFELPVPALEPVFAKSWQREYQRIFGFAKIDRVIQFDGYNKFWAAAFAYGPLFGPKPRFAIYQHNEKYSEYTLKYPYLKAIFKYSALADKVVAVSEMTMQLNKANLAQRFGIAAQKFDYCDNLQNPEYVLSKAQEPMAEEDQALFRPGVFTFITIGRLSLEKDHEKLIRAFSELPAAQQQQAQLLIIGDGPLLPQLTQLILELKLTDQVRLLGRRANPFPLLNQADCFVLSSNHEGQPMVLFEAMILDKHIVSTDIVGSRSALDGTGAHLVSNNIESLSIGLSKCINQEISKPSLDIENYQNRALHMFYDKICN